MVKCLGLAPMRQIAGNDAPYCIGMMPVDIFNTPLERNRWITAVEGFAFWNKVGVGEVNDFHGLTLRGSPLLDSLWLDSAVFALLQPRQIPGKLRKRGKMAGIGRPVDAPPDDNVRDAESITD